MGTPGFKLGLAVSIATILLAVITPVVVHGQDQGGPPQIFSETGFVFQYSQMLKETRLASLMRHSSWVFGVCEILHYIGLTLLMGTVVMLDLRMLGFAKQLPIGPLHQLMPYAVLGFLLNFVTGFMFLSADPFQYIDNPAFLAKMALIVIAGGNIGFFYMVVYDRARTTGPGEEAPFVGKIMALTSICLWMAVLCLGRLLPYLRFSL